MIDEVLIPHLHGLSESPSTVNGVCDRLGLPIPESVRVIQTPDPMPIFAARLVAVGRDSMASHVPRSLQPHDRIARKTLGLLFHLPQTGALEPEM